MSIAGFEVLFDILFAVYQVDLNAKLSVQVFSQMLGRINGAVLAARASETDRQIGKATFHVALDGNVDQSIDVLQESYDFTIVFEEADDRFVQSRERFVAFVFTGVVHGTAVEDEASAVARRIFGNAFLVGEAGDFNHEAALLRVVGELFQFGQFGQHPAEVRVLRIGFMEQLAQVFDGEGDALDEVGFLLEVAAETVGAEYLHGAKQHKVAEPGHETGFVHRLVFAQGVDVFVEQFLAETVGIVGLCLPQEGCYVVVDGAFASALEVDKPRFAVLNQDVAALEVAIHKGGGAAAEQYVGHLLKIIFEAVFLEVEAGGFQEAIFEVIQIPQDAAAVELGLRIAVGEIHPLGSGKLDGGQQAECLAQQLFLVFIEDAGLASFLNGVEEQRVAQVFLEVIDVVVRLDEHLRNG